MLRCLLPLALLAGCSAGDHSTNAAAAVDAATDPQTAGTIPLAIMSGGKTHRFAVEVAITPKEQEKGLMFRKELPADGGMVFPMQPPRTASFWMKDTFIPLDMLFVRTDGTIALLSANARPYSREPVSAGVPVAGVVELKGGRAAELGIGEGDKVQWGDCGSGAEKPSPTRFCPAR